MDDRRRRFEAQVMPHFDAAYRFARWLARSPEGVDDVVQDSILRAYRGFDALRSDDAKSWLLTIVRNCHYTARMQARRHPVVPLPEDCDALNDDAWVATTPDPANAAVRRDEERTLQRMLAALPDDYREILMLREIEEMDYRQIAAVAQIPMGTVMSRLARARAALKKQWLQQSAGGSHAVR